MDTKAYFSDLSAELKAVQNRIRQLIGNVHWPTDGAWKESVLRSVLRGYLPSSVSVGSGFVLTPDGPTSQIDILIYDDSSPVFFKDGDFVIVPPNAVRAVIEVKTAMPKHKLTEVIQKLGTVSRHLRRFCLPQRPFVGLFSYESTDCTHDEVLDALKAQYGNSDDYEPIALSFGDSQFYRFWYVAPDSNRTHDSWHAYTLPQLAPGYFIHNVIEHLFPASFERTQEMWYPIDGKEAHCIGRRKRRDG